jgi:hypothetical protein
MSRAPFPLTLSVLAWTPAPAGPEIEARGLVSLEIGEIGLILHKVAVVVPRDGAPTVRLPEYPKTSVKGLRWRSVGEFRTPADAVAFAAALWAALEASPHFRAAPGRTAAQPRQNAAHAAPPTS